MQPIISTPAIISTYYQSPLGQLRISGTDTYISEISFADNIDKSPGNTADINKAINKVINDKGTGDKRNIDKGTSDAPPTPMIIQCIEQLIQYFQGQRRVFDFPISQEGTDFQLNVWNELMSIPFGKTISYLELSRRLGDTKAIRAAASANGRNNIVIVVPCHRVIGSKRDLVGYGGGLWRKKWLLDHETKILWGVQTLF